MYYYLDALLSDQKGGAVFTCFGTFHILLILGFVALAIFACLYAKNKAEKRDKIIGSFLNIAFGLYVLDFFLMPFAYGEINVEKLPFHVCTTMCVMCFLSRHNAFLGKFRLQFAMLGFISNLVYLIYPAGIMWHEIHPMSYRSLQTLLFHGFMMVYGVMVLTFESKEFCWKKWHKDFIVILAMTAWAWIGNTLYNHETVVYNWFFVVQDPFKMFPEHIAPYIMPFLNVALFSAAELLVYFIFSKLVMPRTVKKQAAG